MDKMTRITIEAAACGQHSDVCCLADRALYDKVVDWWHSFGTENTYNLIVSICECAVDRPAPKPQPGRIEPAVYPTTSTDKPDPPDPIDPGLNVDKPKPVPSCRKLPGKGEVG